MQEAFPWWFYAFMVGFIAIVGWIGYRAGVALWVLLKLGPFRERVASTGIPTQAITATIWIKTIGRLGLFVFVFCGTWVIIRANFFSFRQLKTTDSTIRLNYELSFLDREIPFASVRDVDFKRLRTKRAYQHKYALEIVTSDGKKYQGMDTDDESAIADCRNFVSRFSK